MFQKSRGAITAAATETFPAILTDAGKVSKVALGVTREIQTGFAR
jgi:hypothetical protein